MKSTEIDWSGKMLGISPNVSRTVPVIAKKSREYGMLLIAIRQIELALKPAKAGEILCLLARLKLHYTTNYVSSEEFKYLLRDYLTDLAEYPKDILESACINYRKNTDNQFFPKIGQLIKIMDQIWYPRKAKLTKLKKLLEVSNQSKEV